MKGKYFFKENGKEIEIKEFDYEYVRNSLLKEYNANANRKYCYTIVVDRSYDALGNPVFDVRKLDLNEIYFDTTRLRIQELMLDEIMFDKKLKVQDLPMPKLQKEYQDWKEGRIQIKKAELAPEVLNIPVLPKRERIVVQEDDERIGDIAVYWVQNSDVKDINEVLVLDWIDNFDICNHELAVSSQNISEKKIQLATAINANSEYLHGIFDNLRKTLEELFPLKPNLFKRMFGSTDLVVKETDMNKVLSSMKNAVQFDPTRFEGVKVMFDNILEDIEKLQKNIEHGTIACEYQVQRLDDKLEWELGEQRLEKVSITNDIMKASLISSRNSFMIDLNRMNEINTVLIPLVVDRLQNLGSSKIDADTERTIRALAYGASDKKGSDDENRAY